MTEATNVTSLLRNDICQHVHMGRRHQLSVSGTGVLLVMHSGLWFSEQLFILAKWQGSPSHPQPCGI